MKDTNEEIVGRVLQGLCDAAPPDGMESRIVNVLQHRASTMPIPPRALWKIASFAGGAVLAGVFCALLLTTHRKMAQAAFPHPQAVSMQAMNGPGLLTPLTTATRKPPRAPVPRARLVQAASSRKTEQAVVGYPAPSMPLTEQERLLLRLAHKGDPIQLAMFDPVQRAARYAEDRAQIQKFFSPHTQEIFNEQ